MPSYPLYPERKTHSLNKQWDFTFLQNVEDPQAVDINSIEFTDRMPVPSVFDATPTYLGKRGVGAYHTTLLVTPGTSGTLVFGGLGAWAEVYVDRKKMKTVRLPYSGFTIEIPAADQQKREVCVVIDNRFDFERTPLFEQFFDFYCYGGIYREVYWHEHPAGTVLNRAHVDIIDAQKGQIKVRAFCSQEPQTYKFELNETPVEPGNVSFKDGVLSAEITIANPQLWSCEEPNLYTINVKTDNDSITERFGLREVKIEGKQILLNGKNIRLKGFCRHEAHPQFGPALPPAQITQDMQIIKDLGCNAIRGSHYPQDQRFLDLCDEEGILVFEEALGWGQRNTKYTGEDFGNLQEEQCRLMVQNSYNHPSVIIWGFLNEGGSAMPELRGLFERLFRVVRKEDSSRPVSYATLDCENDLNFDLCDLICLNIYPGWYSRDKEVDKPIFEIPERLRECITALKKMGQADKPLLLSEIGAGAIYGWRDPYNNRWTEGYQKEYLKTVLENFKENKEINGVLLWQFCDGRTYASANCLIRPRAFNNKGLLDEYRRPKEAYDTVKELYNSIK